MPSSGWLPFRKRTPSTIEASPGRIAPGSGGIGVSARRKSRLRIQVAASTPYTQPSPANETSRPAAAGPAIVPTWKMIWLSAAAAAW